MTVDSDVEFEDDEIDDKKHYKLVEDILTLNKKQNLKRPTRTEPTSEISEFNLVKSSSSKKGSVHINELTKALGNRKKQLDISKVIKTKNKKKTTLPAPLHKHQAEQIRRALNYEKSRFQLDKWEALVTSNRVTNLSFPLDGVEKLKIIEKQAEKFPSMWRMKSDLQKELEQLQPVVIKPILKEEEDAENFALTLKELQEKRKEAAKLRAFQSYKEAKLRRQSKIKSKKYHRMLKRERIKEKLKEFEELQKTNPEEAMKKLDDIEKARAEERFSLRHKGTGQWAKNKQVRAKYDKETRQVLAQQLAISRELTQKLKSAGSESEDENMASEVTDDAKTDSTNPWVNGIKPDKEVDDFVSGFRKYWQEHNKNITENENNVQFESNAKENKKEEKPTKKPKLINQKIKKTPKTHKQSPEINKESFVDLNESASTSEWEVSLLHNNVERDSDDVETIFDSLESKLNKKVKNKLGKVKKLTKIKKNNTLKKKTKGLKKIDLTMKPSSQKQIIDEELLETTTGMDESGNDHTVANFSDIKKHLNNIEHKQDQVNINPEKFMEVKKTTLQTAVPDISITDENEDTDMQKDLIHEAFEDDDIAEDFEKDKAKAVDEDTPKDIDLTLPGWGSWGGKGIKPTKKNKRLILKMPPAPPRKDQNKGSLIINEKAQAKIKPLLVSEVPFPFKTVKDYEASIRAPIGNTFVPERAFKKLIEPNIKTKMGAIIEPITKSMLMGKKSVV